MFDMICTGGPYGDCCCNYAVQFDRDYTVGEFVKEVLKEKPGEWGSFEIAATSGRRGNVNTCEYKHGKVTKGFSGDVKGMKIKEVTANGGWSLMHYYLKV